MGEAKDSGVWGRVQPSDPYRLKVRLPLLTPTNASDDKHWRARSRRVGQLRKMFAQLVPDRLRPPEPLREGAVTFRRYSFVRPDWDGLVYSGKYPLDLLHDRLSGRRQILVNDTFDCIGQPHYEWHKTLRGRGFIEVEIEARAPWTWTKS